MTLKDITKYASLNIRKIKAFGGEVLIRNLTIKEMTTITALPEDELLLTLVSYSLVEPKITVKQLSELGASALPDLTKIVNAVNGNE